MNRQVLGNLDKIITALKNQESGTPGRPPCALTTPRHHRRGQAPPRIDARQSGPGDPRTDDAGTPVTFDAVAREAGIHGPGFTQPASEPRSRASGPRPAGPPHRRSGQSAPPTRHCSAPWKLPTPNEPGSWKNDTAPARSTLAPAWSCHGPRRTAGGRDRRLLVTVLNLVDAHPRTIGSLDAGPPGTSPCWMRPGHLLLDAPAAGQRDHRLPSSR